MEVLGLGIGRWDGARWRFLGQQLEQQQLCRTGRQKLVIARDKNKRLALQALGRGNRLEICRHKGRLEPGDFVGLDWGAGPDLAPAGL
jgi:hypothetical protein